jgi:LPXTG-motif cell wall-anchored protein
MRHLAPLAVAYALVAALIVPSSPLAQGDASPGAVSTTETAPAAPAPEPAPDSHPVAPRTDAVATPGGAAPPSGSSEPAPAPVAGDPTAAARQRGQQQGRQVATAAASVTVTIEDFEFSPSAVTIDQGDTVTWHNVGPTPHSATAKDGSFDTDVFSKGGSRRHTFNQPGTFSYYCKPHPFMKGTVTVRAASAGGESGSGSAGGSDTGSASSGGGSSSSSSDASGTDSSSSSSSSLPATGGDVVALALLGLLMVAVGALMNRSARAGEQRG